MWDSPGEVNQGLGLRFGFCPITANSDFMISQAIETIQFKMDEAGVKLKSEAAMIVGCTSVMMPIARTLNSWTL